MLEVRWHRTLDTNFLIVKCSSIAKDNILKYLVIVHGLRPS